jgi:hypothetical protein
MILEECNTFEFFRRNKYRLKWVRSKAEILSGVDLNRDMEEIIVGPVDEWKRPSIGQKFGRLCDREG